jgi:hypothetical protein
MDEQPDDKNLGGRPPRWNLGKTQTIRVPIAIADELLAIAERMDKRGKEDLTQNPEFKFLSSEVLM